MPASPRHGAWHFQTLWAIPASIRITNADTSDCLVVVDAVLTRDLLERDTRPPHLASVQLKYKYSDLRLALSTPPRSLPLTGYIQSEPHRAVDIHMLLRWLPATWSPVSGQLGRLDAYRNWLIEIGPAQCQDWFLAPGHRHVQMARQPSPIAERPRCLCRMLASPFVLQIFQFVIVWDIPLGCASTHLFPFSA